MEIFTSGKYARMTLYIYNMTSLFLKIENRGENGERLEEMWCDHKYVLLNMNKKQFVSKYLRKCDVGSNVKSGIPRVSSKKSRSQLSGKLISRHISFGEARSIFRRIFIGHLP